MPLLDTTGPRGKGPRTGRGLGKCKKKGQKNINRERINKRRKV